MPDREQLEADLLRFVQSRCPPGVQATAQTDMLEDGILDSLLLMDLIFQIEERYGVRLEGEHVSPMNFRTIAKIVDLVMNQLPAAGETIRS